MNEPAAARDDGYPVNTTITINGKQYTSPEEMPPDVRRIYDMAVKMGGPVFADHDGNGVPDVLEGKAGLKVMQSTFKVALPLSFHARIGPRRGDGGSAPPTGGPSPIEPAGMEAGIRTLLVTVVLLAAGAALWWWMAHR